jgi:protein SCO1/2
MRRVAAGVRAALTRARSLIMAGLVTGALASAACDRAPRFDGVAVDPPRPMPAFAFRLADGSEFSTAPRAGRPLVLFFGYTHCPDVCPTTLADWKRVRQKLGPRADSVRFVFVTVDPDRDTPAVAQRYAQQYDRTFVGVSGDAPVTARIMEAFGVAAAKEEGSAASGYLVSHSSQAFLVDDAGRLVALYPFGTRWEALAADLDRLL